METVRPSLAVVATALGGLNQEQMSGLVARRLMSEQPQSPLPSLYRNESPGDILIDSYMLLKDHGRELTTLKMAGTIFIKQVLEWDNELIKNRSDVVMEIMWLCSRLGLKDTAHIVGCLGMRDWSLSVKLPNGEPLSNFALRVLVGMFAPSDFFYKVPKSGN